MVNHLSVILGQKYDISLSDLLCQKLVRKNQKLVNSWSEVHSEFASKWSRRMSDVCVEVSQLVFIEFRQKLARSW